MRKFTALLLLTVCILSLAACGGGKKDSISRINGMLQMTHERYTVTIKTTDTFGTLESSFQVVSEAGERRVVYAVERFAGLSLDASPSDDRIEVLEGVAAVQEGEPVDIPAFGRIDLQASPFAALVRADLTSLREEKGYFSADIREGSEMLAAFGDVADASMVIEYGTDCITKLTLQYTHGTETVTVTYYYTSA